jgi:hypothetical protein
VVGAGTDDAGLDASADPVGVESGLDVADPPLSHPLKMPATMNSTSTPALTPLIRKCRRHQAQKARPFPVRRAIYDISRRGIGTSVERTRSIVNPAAMTASGSPG